MNAKNQGLSTKDIDALALEIKGFLIAKGMYENLDIYFNDKSMTAGVEKVKENIRVDAYFSNSSGCLSMSFRFESGFNKLMHDPKAKVDREEFYQLLSQHGLEYVIGDQWNLTCLRADRDKTKNEDCDHNYKSGAHGKRKPQGNER